MIYYPGLPVIRPPGQGPGSAAYATRGTEGLSWPRRDAATHGFLELYLRHGPNNGAPPEPDKGLT
eukprot:5044880-Pyramimonas_sp.AAC.1